MYVSRVKYLISYNSLVLNEPLSRSQTFTVDGNFKKVEQEKEKTKSTLATRKRPVGCLDILPLRHLGVHVVTPQRLVRRVVLPDLFNESTIIYSRPKTEIY